MNELTGGLIQMTAHMERTAVASRLIAAGAIVAAVFGFLAVCAAMSRMKEHKRRYVLAFLAFALLGVALFIGGEKKPRVKVLYCCADGPVSLESIGTRYDIRTVDGKLLVLAER